MSTIQTDSYGIRCTQDNIAEIEDGRAVVIVSRQEIQKLTLRHGFQAPNPATQIVMGICLTALGYIPALHMIHFLIHGGVFFTWEIGIVPFAMIGLYVIFTAFKRGYFIEVQKPQGKTFLALHGSPQSAELKALINSIESTLTVKIEHDITPFTTIAS